MTQYARVGQKPNALVIQSLNRRPSPGDRGQPGVRSQRSEQSLRYRSLMAPSPPAGWYPDPTEKDGGLRYWDGRGWTDQTCIPDPETPHATVRIIREAAIFRATAPLYLVLDEVTMGALQPKGTTEFTTTPGRHQIYVRGDAGALSNAVELDLIAGSVIIFGCRPAPNGFLTPGFMTAPFGGRQPQAIKLFQRSH